MLRTRLHPRLIIRLCHHLLRMKVQLPNLLLINIPKRGVLPTPSHFLKIHLPEVITLVLDDLEYDRVLLPLVLQRDLLIQDSDCFFVFHV